MDKDGNNNFSRKAGILALICILLGSLQMILPYAQYRSGNKYYGLTGYDLAFGRLIMKGTVKVGPVTTIKVILFLYILGAAAAIILLLNKKKLIKAAGTVLAVSGVGQLICYVITIITMKDILSGVKKAGTRYGIYTGILTALILTIIACYVLTKSKVLCVLDFMVLPGVCYMIINNYLPMAGISIAWKRLDFQVGIWRSPWIGWDNFRFLFRSGDAGMIIRNTLLYNLVFIILGMICGCFIGICLAEVCSKLLQRFSQTLILLPQLISMVIVAYLAYCFLSTSSGWLNKGLLGGANINWYGAPKYWPFILVFIHIWKGLGYSSIIYLSAIVGIDQNLYEAAVIDGCGRLQRIFKITIPLLRPTIVTLLIMQCGRIMYSDFGLFYQVPMNSGALYSVTTTLDVYVYRCLMQLNNMSMSSAASAFQSICGFILVMTVNLITRRLDRENAIF